MGAALAALVLLPRLAYVGALAAVGFVAAVVAVVLVYSAIRVPRPVPEPFLVLALAAWVAAYLAAGYAATRDIPVVRPWLRAPHGRERR